MNTFVDTLAKKAFGQTTQEAIDKGLCIACGEPAKFYSEAGKREYQITGMCEYCYDACCPEEEYPDE